MDRFAQVPSNTVGCIRRFPEAFSVRPPGQHEDGTAMHRFPHLNVRHVVSHHDRPLQINCEPPGSLAKQSCSGLTARATLLRRVGAVIDGIDLSAGLPNGPEHPLGDLLQSGGRIDAPPYPGLIGDDNDSQTGGLQGSKRGQNASKEPELLPSRDVSLSLWRNVDDPVPIQKDGSVRQQELLRI